MGNGIEDRRAAAAESVPWSKLYRTVAFRTSKPTNAAARRLVGRVAVARGRRPLTDAVIMAALQLAENLTEADLLEAVAAVEAKRYEVHSQHGDPGEPEDDETSEPIE